MNRKKMFWIFCLIRGHKFTANVNTENEVQKLDKNPQHTEQGINLGTVICSNCDRNHNIEKYAYLFPSRQISIKYNNGKQLFSKHQIHEKK